MHGQVGESGGHAALLLTTHAGSLVSGGHYHRRKRVVPDPDAPDPSLLRALVERLDRDDR